jgi:Molybdate transporter of MFS superfamily
MAGHVRFSARDSGSLVILGAVLWIVAVFFSSSMATFLRLFPSSIVGVILFLTGARDQQGQG